MTDWHATYALESDLSEAVKSYLSQRGDCCITRTESGGAGKRKVTTKGTADWSGVVLGGRHVEIELKRKDGKSRPAQEQRCVAVRRMGGVYEVCRTVAEVHAAVEKARGAA